MSFKVDLNCDLGESFGKYRIGRDEDILPWISSCNIACGYHASDPCVMSRTVAQAVAHGVALGAHPGLPDLIGFGRRNMAITPQEAADYVTYQVGALWAFAKANGCPVQHVKLHGALYNMAAKDYNLSLAIAKAIQKMDDSLIFMGLSGSQMIKAAQDIGLHYAQEVFADRAYMPDGTLVPRSQPGAMVTSTLECISRVIRMVQRGKVSAINGEDITIHADSICVHGDSETALKFVQALNKAIKKEGINLAAFR